MSSRDLLEEAAVLLGKASDDNEARAQRAARIAEADPASAKAAADLESVNLRRLELAELMIAHTAASRNLRPGCCCPEGGRL